MIDGTPARVPLPRLVTFTESGTLDVIAPGSATGKRAVVALPAAIESGWNTTLSCAGGVWSRVPTRATIDAVRTESPNTKSFGRIVTLWPGTVVTTNVGSTVSIVSPALSTATTRNGATTPASLRSVSLTATAGEGRITGE